MEKIISIILGVIAVTTLVGNIFVIILFLKRREWLKKLHNCLLLNLAMQDFITAVSLLAVSGLFLPSDGYKLPSNETSRKFYCRLIWSHYIPFAMSTGSIYTCLMLAIDRWHAVLKPMAFRSFSTTPRNIALMVILPWIAGFTLRIRLANTEILQKRNGSYVCKRMAIEPPTKNTVLVLWMLFVQILLPVVVMSIAYTNIVNKLRQTRQHGETNASHHSFSQGLPARSLRRLTKLVFIASAIVVVFCLPDELHYCLSQLHLVENHNTLTILCLFTFLNTCANPFLYTFSNTQYQAELKNIFRCMFHRQERPSVDEITQHNTIQTQVTVL